MKVIDSIIKRFSSPVDYAQRLGVNIGGGCQFVGHPDWGSEPYLITIGNNVRISFDVAFVNHDGGIWTVRKCSDYKGVIKVGKISIGDNCFIGARTIILPGVHIGNNCVIGAGSIVTKSITDNMVYAGVPARFICTLDEYIKKTVEQCPVYNASALKTDKKGELLRILQEMELHENGSKV